MKLKCLACDVLARPLYLSAAHSPHIVDIELFPRGLHNTPAILRGRLQERIDAAAGQGYDAVVMAYGLCGQATAGLTAREKPVVVPRAHDCITLFLGGRERYDAQFEQQPGTYWYALDYMERDDGTGGSMGLGAGAGTEGQAVYEQYVEKYGQDNADYLMEVMGAVAGPLQARRLRRSGRGRRQQGRAHGPGRRRAPRLGLREGGWRHGAGAPAAVRGLGEDFLVWQPGQSLAMSYDDR